MSSGIRDKHIVKLHFSDNVFGDCPQLSDELFINRYERLTILTVQDDKIKRIIFETLHKSDGTVERPLSVSQIKQIAGRAGCYGLYGEQGGFVTILHAHELSMLHSAVSRQPDSIMFAGISPALENVLQALPPDASHRTLMEVAPYVANVRPPCRAFVPSKVEERSRFVETHLKDMKLYEKLLIGGSPMSWLDGAASAS
ncbi:hypothetical protein K503DRAFT_802364 [Rhizopogon vinicolor AM-OR11-026]|uniref:Uncharacterized protein n=1 Tax=Rhizopogon vinicolor AM-OR11-026 TaxID=1314800 RepID=A0A1B7MTU0_9AGAM|nr:hypothetical protein K503DRAFT_802364 [Rhizopogon vinicolor AM-OR11-026]